MTRLHSAFALALLGLLYAVGALALYVALGDLMPRTMGEAGAIIKGSLYIIFAVCLAGAAGVHAILARRDP